VVCGTKNAKGSDDAEILLSLSIRLQERGYWRQCGPRMGGLGRRELSLHKVSA